MDRLDLGAIPPESIQRVRLAVRKVAPKAVSVRKIREEATIRLESLDKILRYLELLNVVERVETTSGDFWRWRGNSDG